MTQIKDIISNKQLTYRQKLVQLATAAENTLELNGLSDDIREYMHKDIICDLYEGNAPYRPRYILPDYEKFMKNGSDFLNLPPPENLPEALNSLQILYQHVPSITSFPVYLGRLDKLLNPFIEDEETAFQLIKLFLIQIDRTLTDSFVHANIGPVDSTAARIILKAEAELQNAVPNLSLLYDEDVTPDELALEAVRTGLKAAKPYFANHRMYLKDYGEEYGIASCYNGLPVGGGSYTLVRINLKLLAQEANDVDDFFDNVLPKGVQLMTRLTDARIAFLREESGFFESNFLVKEGLISPDRFTAMFGLHGLAECVNHLRQAAKLEEKFGHNEASDRLGERILKNLEEELNKHHNAYCKISDGKFLLHAQCGIGTDKDASPACRIPAGEEPETFRHIVQASLYHKYFPAGISDIFTFDETAEHNPQFLLDIAKGAMKSGIRSFAFYKNNADLIRITGYLVKKSDMQKYKNGELNREATVALGAPASESLKINQRKIVHFD
jgi:YjjI family glycine radical enzyme